MIDLNIHRRQCLAHGCDTCSNHQFSCRDASAIHKAKQRTDPDRSLALWIFQLPFQLEGNPRIQAAGPRSILRCIQDPHHDAAGNRNQISLPFLASKYDLSPGCKHPANIRHTVRQTNLLRQLCIANLTNCRRQTPAGTAPKLQFHRITPCMRFYQSIFGVGQVYAFYLRRRPPNPRITNTVPPQIQKKPDPRQCPIKSPRPNPSMMHPSKCCLLHIKTPPAQLMQGVNGFELSRQDMPS